jgi:hypothetical protein
MVDAATTSGRAAPVVLKEAGRSFEIQDECARGSGSVLLHAVVVDAEGEKHVCVAKVREACCYPRRGLQRVEFGCAARADSCCICTKEERGGGERLREGWA